MSDLDVQPIDLIRDRAATLRALRQAAADAMLRHKQAGVPVATWDDGKVVWIAPEDIVIPDDDDVLVLGEGT